MAGSEAEERIRAKAEEMLRLRWPEARIVHELQLQEGWCRIDLAAICPDFLCVVEIKSEKDPLKRLPRQLHVATQVANECWLCVAPKHEAGLAEARRYDRTNVTKADHELSRALGNTRVFVERDPADRFLTPQPYAAQTPPTWPDPRLQFQMLWAAEMSRVLHPYGGAHGNMSQKARRAVEWLTGAQIRKAVCQELRRRPFPRADPADPMPKTFLDEPEALLV